MSEELNKQLDSLKLQDNQQQLQQQAQQAEESKINQDQSEQQPQGEIKKKKVIKSVRFNILPADENQPKGLFPATLPEQTPQEKVGEEQPALDTGYTDKEINEMEQIKVWLFANFKRDVDNAKSKGANPVELKVKNFVLLRKEDNQLWNRVEFDTSFDFTTIEQILISPEEAHPQQPTLKYATIVLFGKNKNVPLVFPYCFQKEDIVEEIEQGIVDSKNKKEKKKLKKKLKKKMGNYTANELDNWIFLNSSLKEAKHRINEFQNI